MRSIDPWSYHKSLGNKERMCMVYGHVCVCLCVCVCVSVCVVCVLKEEEDERDSLHIFAFCYLLNDFAS